MAQTTANESKIQLSNLSLFHYPFLMNGWAELLEDCCLHQQSALDPVRCLLSTIGWKTVAKKILKFSDFFSCNCGEIHHKTKKIWKIHTTLYLKIFPLWTFIRKKKEYEFQKLFFVILYHILIGKSYIPTFSLSLLNKKHQCIIPKLHFLLTNLAPVYCVCFKD